MDGNTGACKVNGSTVLTTTTGAYDTATGPFSILGGHELGAGLAAKQGTALSYIPKCKIYSFKVTDTNNVTKCDMVPAVRISDSAVGMYDRARHVFIEKYGSAALIPGYVDVAITNSASSISSLIVSGDSTNDAVKVTGNVRLVKTGAGTYLPTKAGQTYTGGTIVSNGVVSVKGNGTTALLGTAGGNIVKNGTFDDAGTTSGSGNSGNWNYAQASGFNLPNWNISNTSCMGLSKASGIWVASGLDVGTYAFYMRTSDMDNKGHTGDITLEQGGLALSRGRYRIAYDYATRKNAAHYPVTNHCNIVKGNVTNELGVTVATSAQQTALASTEWFFEIGEGDEGVYTLQFLQTIADNGSAERTTILDNIIVEKIAAEIVVESGATLALASGARDFTDCRFTMNGGTLKDSSGAGGSNALVANMRLTADSYWENMAGGGFVGRDGADTLLDLGGYTLEVLSENSQELNFKNTTIMNGTMIAPEHLFLNFSGDCVTAMNAMLDVQSLLRLNAPVLVGDYVARRNNATNADGLRIYGTLSIASCSSYHCSIMYCTITGGATIDFSQAMAAVSGLQFAENATVTIRLGDSHLSNPIISWTSLPANVTTGTFVRDASESGYKLEVRSDGLYAMRKGFMLIVK